MVNFNGQSPYGNFPEGLGETITQSNKILPDKAEKRQLMLLSFIAGLCVLSYLGLSELNYRIIIHTDLIKLFKMGYPVRSAMDIILSIICIFLPFFIALFPLKKISDREILKYNKPITWKIFFISVCIGLIAFVLSNIITALFIILLKRFGIELTSSESDIPNGINNLLIYCLRGAVLPALIEEFAIRGVIMQPLRKFGDGFAVISSSFIFGIMHGNLIQAPFAFMLGCVIGYLVIITESLWTGVVIHFLNNMYSIIMTSLQNNMPYDNFEKIIITVAFTLIVIGLLAFIYFLSHRNEFPRLQAPVRGISRKYYNRRAALIYMTTPSMLVAIGFLIYYTSDYVSFGG